jgi:hypothetical protein
MKKLKEFELFFKTYESAKRFYSETIEHFGNPSEVYKLTDNSILWVRGSYSFYLDISKVKDNVFCVKLIIKNDYKNTKKERSKR